MQEEITDEYIVQSSKPVNRVIASCIGGTLAAFVVTPFDVVKARMQAQIGQPNQFSGALDAALRIGKIEGITSLWRGLGTALIMTIPANAFYFTTYEAFRDKLRREYGLSATVAPGVAGLGARILTVTISSPVEMVRTHLQATSSTLVNNHGLVPTLKIIAKSRGLQSLWSGLIPTLWRDAPFSAIYWSAYEFLKLLILPHFGTSNSNRFSVDFLSGAGAGMIAAIFSHPFDVIKTQRQMHIFEEQKQVRTVYLLRKLAKEEGIKGLTKGIVPRVIKVAPACAIMISSYELCKKYLSL